MLGNLAIVDRQDVDHIVRELFPGCRYSHEGPRMGAAKRLVGENLVALGRLFVDLYSQVRHALKECLEEHLRAFTIGRNTGTCGMIHKGRGDIAIKGAQIVLALKLVNKS